MKVLIVADIESPYLWSHFDANVFKDVDLILSCGDLRADYLSYLVTMIPAPLFYVHGNHDGQYLTQPPEGCECIDGKLITYKNIRILGFDGCRQYNGGSFQYTEKQMSKRVFKLLPSLWWHKGVDILLTHAPAYKINDGDDLCHQGFRCFNKFIDRYSPKYFFHGHQHLSYNMQPRIVQLKNTTIINAFGYYLLEYTFPGIKNTSLQE